MAGQFTSAYACTPMALPVTDFLLSSAAPGKPFLRETRAMTEEPGPFLRSGSRLLLFDSDYMPRAATTGHMNNNEKESAQGRRCMLCFPPCCLEQTFLNVIFPFRIDRDAD